jgi:hypothetical protein
MDKTLDAQAVAGAQGGGPNKAYVRDTVHGTTEMVSLVDGAEGQPDTIINGQGIKPVITPDGRYVAFASDAGALQGATEGEETTFQQVYVRDLGTETTIPVSLATDGVAFGNGGSSTTYGPSISDDGRYVAFESDAGNLVEGDTNGDTDAFVRDLQAGTTTRISLDDQGRQVTLSPDSDPPVSRAAAAALTNRSPLTVRYTADDPVFPSLGVAEVRLYLRRPGETTFTLRQTDKAPNLDGRFVVATSGRNGVYAFKTQAVDGNGNVEALPGAADATTRFDNVAPRINALRVVPMRFHIGAQHRAQIRTRVPESAYRTVLIKHDGIVIKHFATRRLAAGLRIQSWLGRNDAGVRVHSGRYVAVLKARDLAGNVRTQKVAFRVTR